MRANDDGVTSAMSTSPRPMARTLSTCPRPLQIAMRVKGPERLAISRESQPATRCNSPPPRSPLSESSKLRLIFGSGAATSPPLARWRESIDGLPDLLGRRAELRQHLGADAIWIRDKCEEQRHRRDRGRAPIVGDPVRALE